MVGVLSRGDAAAPSNGLLSRTPATRVAGRAAYTPSVSAQCRAEYRAALGAKYRPEYRAVLRDELRAGRRADRWAADLPAARRAGHTGPGTRCLCPTLHPTPLALAHRLPSLEPSGLS